MTDTSGRARDPRPFRQRSHDLLTGVLAALPSFGPNVSLLLLHRTRWTRRDVLWLLGIVLVGIPAVLHREPQVLLSVVLGFLLFKAGGAAQRTQASVPRGVPLLLGLIALQTVGWFQLLVLRWERASGWSWIGDPNLYGHTLLTVGGIATVVLPSRWMRAIAALLTVGGAFVTGSRSVLIGVVVLFAIVLTDRRRWPRRWTLVVATLMTAALLMLDGRATERLATGLQLLRNTPNIVPNLVSPTNLLFSSEELNDSRRWRPLSVEVTRGEDGSDRAVWSVRKTGPEAWARVQQTVRLEPNTTYTLSGRVRTPDTTTQPGFLGWGTTGTTTVSLQLTLADGSWAVTSAGDVRTLALETRTDDGWWSIEITFLYSGAERVAWGFGPTPDQRPNAIGSELLLGSLQLERGAEASAYRPTYAVAADQGTMLSRLPIWAAAVAGWRAAPLLGHGAKAYPAIYLTHIPTFTGATTPQHAHHFGLQALVAYGAVGVSGFAILLLGLAISLLRQRLRGGIGLLCALLVANLFDATLLFSGVLFPLALSLGWLTSKGHGADPTRTRPPSGPALQREERSILGSEGGTSMPSETAEGSPSEGRR